MEAIERSGETKMPLYDCLLFDLDDTLYPLNSGLQAACRKNIEEYMIQKLNIDESEVPTMCYDLYKIHGTTMAGLKALGYEFDNDEFHSFVHGRLPYENLRPDPLLRSLLLSMPQRKIIFTNSDKIHAAKCLSRLGLEDCFEGVICFETLNSSSQPTNNTDALETAMLSSQDLVFSNGSAPRQEDDNVPGLETVMLSSQDLVFSNGTAPRQEDDNVLGLETVMLSSQDLVFSNGSAPCQEDDNALPNDLEFLPPNPENSKSSILCKPSLEAVEFALKIANADPKRTILFDDSTRNIAIAKVAGLHTVLVGSSVRTEGADFALRSIHNIKEALPEIWEDEEKSELPTPSIAIETLVVSA